MSAIATSTDMVASQRTVRILSALIVWAALYAFALFLMPTHHDAGAAEILYYSLYDVGVGALIGFVLLDRFEQYGGAGVALRALALILVGTGVNEALIEPYLFGAAPINAEGFFYGIQSTAAVVTIFLLVGLSGRPGDAAEPPPAQMSVARSDLVLLPVDGAQVPVLASTIRSMRAERDYTHVTTDQGSHFVSETLGRLVARCAHGGLVRVHKSHAVGLAHVEAVRASSVSVAGEDIPIGRRYAPAFRERLAFD